MGRQKIFDRIAKYANRKVMWGTILGILHALFAAVLFIGGAWQLGIFILIFVVLYAVLAASGFRDKKHPEKSRILKKDRLLEQADELFDNLVYEDDFVMFSEKTIANKKNIFQMAYFEDVTRVYELTESTNFVRTGHYIVINAGKDTIRINVYAKKKETIQQLLEKIKAFCPNLESEM